jgi:hypothetical protein
MMNIGSDKVYVEGDRVSIHAAEPMDWPVREFHKVPILFQGKKYYLRSKRSAEPPRPTIYELWPWPLDLHEASPQSVVYNEAYILKRDQAAANACRRHMIYLILLPFYPFLGLLWSRFKSRILSPLGFEPGSITKASILLMFNLVIVEGIFFGWLAGGILAYFLGRPALRPVDGVLLILLGADSLVRYSQSLKLDVQRHWGFCEWLMP